jgi:hypothetical protein
MGLRYSGSADESEGLVYIYGDGQSTTVTIDLTQSPFDMTFTGTKGSPTGVILMEDVSDPDASVSIASLGQLTITYDTPPPAADFSRTPPGAREIWFRLIYG